ncbi:MAG: hypothetical protein ACLGHQ_13905 [Acidimicrobiia bacterium]
MQKRSLTKQLGAASGGVAVLLAVLGGAASVAAGDAFDAGDVAIVDPANPRLPLVEGDSTTAFTLRLPDDARCGGDSLNDGWRVHTFLVPESTDLSSMVYDANHPIGDGNLPMRDINGRLYVHKMTDVNPGPAQEAAIPPLPALTLAYWEPKDVPTGTYKVGVACAPASRVVERYWDATIVVTEDREVDPGERRWEVAEDSRVPDEFPTIRVVLIGLALAASAVVVLITWQGRRARAARDLPQPDGAVSPAPPENQGASSS